jgi:hypothetical protein
MLLNTAKFSPAKESLMTESDSTTAEALPLDPEAQARVDQLMHGLEHNPAVTCLISYNWYGTREQADRASIRIRLYGQLMREACPEMSFSALTAITFHHDYELALAEATGADRSAPLATKEAGGLSVGMMVRAGDGVHLVMHESVALALAADEIEQSDWAQHVVRHELCHVSDFVFKRGLIAKHPDQCAFAGFDALMAPLAEALWDEFYANKYSSGTWSDPRTFLDLLRDTLPTIRQEIVDAILEYRTARDLDGLLSFAKAKVKFVAQCFGYAAGSLAARGVKLPEAAPEEHAMLVRFGLVDAWHQCFDTLEDLDRIRPEWESALDLMKLFPACVALLAGFGLHYRPHGDGAYVEIPFTPETDPIEVAKARFGY